MKKLLLYLITFLWLAYSINASAISIAGDFTHEKYNRSLFTKEQTERWNIMCEKNVHTVQSVFYQEEYISKTQIKNMISGISYIPSSIRYSTEGNILTSGYYENIMKKMNLDKLSDFNAVRYGISVKRTFMKKFPTDDMAFSSRTSPYDRFLETTLYPGEPMAVFWESSDDKWLFVRIYNYEGWVKKQDVALCTKDAAEIYSSTRSFIVITEPKTYGISTATELDMGVRLPLIREYDDFYEVFLPARDNNGNFVLSKEKVRKSHASLGYLSYTINNVLLQAEKFIGERYGWGGMHNARDCSALIMDIFRTFGIKVPRNTDEQELMPGITIDLSGKERDYLYNHLIPGTLLFMNGHVMIYMGRINEDYYILHNTPGYYRVVDNKKEYVNSDGVVITNLDIYTSSGTSYRDSIRKAIFISTLIN